MWCVVRVSLSVSLFSFLYAFLSHSRPPFLSCPSVVKRVSGEDYQTLIKLSTAATGLTYVRPFLSRGWRTTRFQVEPLVRRSRSYRKLLNERSEVRDLRDLGKERSEVNLPLDSRVTICKYSNPHL